MGKQVSVADAHAAIDLVQFAYFKKVQPKEKRKRARSVDGASTDEDEDGQRPAATQASTTSPSQRRSKRTRVEETATYDLEDSEDINMIQPPDAGDLTQRPTRRSILLQQSEETSTTRLHQRGAFRCVQTETEPSI